MLPGFNHNVRFKSRIYHVQTEDNGLKAASVVTQVFLAGQVLGFEKVSYQDVLDEDWDEQERASQIRHLMQEQHKTLLKKVTEGVFEDRVEALITEGVAAADAGLAPELPVPPLAEQGTTDPLPTFAEAMTLEGQDSTVRLEESDFLSSLDAEVRRHIEASDPTLPPFDSSILPAEPPPIPPRASSRMSSSLGNSPLRTRRMRSPGPRDTLADEASPLATPDRSSGEQRSVRPVRFRRPASSTTVRPIEQDELRKASAELGLPMPEEGGYTDPNATLLELDAVALKAKLAEQRAKLKRATQLADAKWPNGTSPRSDPTNERLTVNERSLDEVLLSYLDDE